MATVAATTSATLSATSALQGTLLRSRVEAARREADQAEAQAQTLRAQADAQEQVVDQAHQRVSSLEKGANRVANALVVAPQVATETPSQPAADKSPTLVQDSLTYIKALSELFQFAKPIIATATTSSQKNRVKASLFDATQQALLTLPTGSQARQTYRQQSVTAASATTGQVLNATV